MNLHLRRWINCVRFNYLSLNRKLFELSSDYHYFICVVAFTLLFCRGQLLNVQRFITNVYIYCSAHGNVCFFLRLRCHLPIFKERKQSTFEFTLHLIISHIHRMQIWRTTRSEAGTSMKVRLVRSTLLPR